jgi:hypothetical protein
VIHPVSLLRSWTPVEPMCPCLGGHIGAAPTSGTVKASDDEHFGAHSRSFGTCSPTLRVSCCHSRARLASGWLAGLYREGVEPSGSLRKVSDHMTILLSCSPDATLIAFNGMFILDRRFRSCNPLLLAQALPRTFTRPTRVRWEESACSTVASTYRRSDAMCFAYCALLPLE